MKKEPEMLREERSTGAESPGLGALKGLQEKENAMVVKNEIKLKRARVSSSRHEGWALVVHLEA